MAKDTRKQQQGKISTLVLGADLGPRGVGKARKAEDPATKQALVVTTIAEDAVGNSKSRRYFKRHLENLPMVQNNASVQSLKRQLGLLQEQDLQMKQKLGERHPERLKLRLSIQTAQERPPRLDSAGRFVNQAISTDRNREYYRRTGPSTGCAAMLELLRNEFVGLNGIVNVSNLIFIIGLSVRGLLPLRLLSITSSLNILPYYYLQPETLWPPIFWNSVSILINSTRVVQLPTLPGTPPAVW